MVLSKILKFLKPLNPPKEVHLNPISCNVLMYFLSFRYEAHVTHMYIVSDIDEFNASIDKPSTLFIGSSGVLNTSSLKGLSIVFPFITH